MRRDTPLPAWCKLQHGQRGPNFPQTWVSAEKSARSWGDARAREGPLPPLGPPTLPGARPSRRWSLRGVDTAEPGCGSREEHLLVEGVEWGGLGIAVLALGGAWRGTLTASWWAHCGAAPRAHRALPGAGGGGGSRTLGAAATSLQERAAGVMARAGQCAGAAPPRPAHRATAARARLPLPRPRPLGAVLTAAPPCPQAPDRTRREPGRCGGGAGPSRRLSGESARGVPGARATGLHLPTSVSSSPAREEPGESLGRGPGRRGALHRAPIPEPGCQAPRSCASQLWVMKRRTTHA